MAVPQTYRKSSEGIITYDYFDVASATGLETFYLGKTVDKYLLANVAFYSDAVMTNSNQVYSDGSFVLLHDIDFDTEFKLPRTLQGEAVVNVPFGIFAVTAGDTFSAYIIIKLRKWDGTTETEIVNNQGSTISITTAGGNEYEYGMASIDLTVPKTHFKAGETLRVTVEYYAKNHDDPSNADFFFGHDPNARATSDQDTRTFGSEVGAAQSIALIPFDLDL